MLHKQELSRRSPWCSLSSEQLQEKGQKHHAKAPRGAANGRGAGEDAESSIASIRKPVFSSRDTMPRCKRENKKELELQTHEALRRHMAKRYPWLGPRAKERTCRAGQQDNVPRE